MNYKILLLLFLPMLLHSQYNRNMGELFDSLKVNPQYKSNEIIMERAVLNRSMANSLLFPKITAFGKYDYANSPTGMLPVAPNDLIIMVQDPIMPQPFSENIFRAGAGVSMPIFAKSIYTMAAKAKIMYQSAEVKADIDLQRNEAIIVSSNANLQYIESLFLALDKKKTSLLKAKELIEIKVKNGRVPESALLKINSNINGIDIMHSQVALNREKTLATIFSLTNVKLDSSVSMIQTGDYTKGQLKVLHPLKKKIEASKLGVRAEKEKLYPALVFNGNYNHAYAKAYNNNEIINTDYATVGLTLRVPIFEKEQYAKVKLSKLDVLDQENELDKMRLEFTSEALQLENSLQILYNSEELYSKSIDDKTELLNIAKVSYKNDRISIEDYLKYEDDLLLEKSKLYQIQAQKWQTLMKLAVIYGNNIEEIIK